MDWTGSLSPPFRLPSQSQSRGWTGLFGLLAALSTGAKPPTYDFTEDVDTVRSTVMELVQSRDVIVVMHSYSGIPGGSALEGLDKKSCRENGLPGGVVRLIYIMSLMVPEGFQVSPRGTRDNFAPSMKTDLEAGVVTIAPEDAKKLFYQDLPDDVVADLAKKLRPQSLGVFYSKTTHAAWRHIPTTFVVCNKDTPTTVAAMRWLISSARESGNHKLDTVIERDVGHSPFLSQLEWTVSMLREAAGEKIA